MFGLFDIFASLALGFAFFGGGGGVKPAAPAPSPPSETDPEVQAKRAARRYRAGLEQGFSSTIATSPLGNSGSVNQQGNSIAKLGG